MLDSDLVKRLRNLSNEVWAVVAAMPILAQRTVGEQLVRSVDSIGANLVEGDGRGSQPDTLKFFRIARASLRETEYWLTLADDRKLVDHAIVARWLDELSQLSRMLSSLIAYRERQKVTGVVRETIANYVPEDA